MSVLQKAAKAELKRRKSITSDDAVEKLLRLLSPIQKQFVLDSHRFKIARCGRRAGKSFADAVYLIIECLRTPKAPCLYLGLTRDSAKAIIWGLLLMILDELRIVHEAIEGNLLIKFPNGSSIQIMGADMANMRDRMRGRKHRLVIVDEMGFFSGSDSLIQALMPTLTDLSGSFVMTSSPGNLLAGFFYECDEGDKKGGWSHYYWTLLDNPYFMSPSKNPKFKTLGEEELDIMVHTLFGGDWRHPTFLQEFMGLWVKNLTNLIYPIADKNIIDAPVVMDEQEFGVGINLEAGSNNAVVVMRFSRYSREVQITETWTNPSSSIDDLANKINELMRTLDPTYVVAVTGEYTKKIVNELTRRYPGLAMSPSDPKDKTFYQRVMRTDILNNYVKVVKDLSILKEWNVLTRNGQDEEVEGPDNHLSDAALHLYKKVYSGHLKSYTPRKTEEQRMVELIEAQALEEKREREDALQY